MVANTTSHPNTHYTTTTHNDPAIRTNLNSFKHQPKHSRTPPTKKGTTLQYLNKYTTPQPPFTSTQRKHPTRPRHHHTKHTENRSAQPLKHRHHCPHIKPQPRHPLPYRNPYGQRLLRPLRHSNQQRIQLTLPPSQQPTRKHRQHTRGTTPKSLRASRGRLHDSLQKGQTLVFLLTTLPSPKHHLPSDSVRLRRHTSHRTKKPTSNVLPPTRPRRTCSLMYSSQHTN